MRWLNTEYILKGVYLGLVLFAALSQAAEKQADAWAGPICVFLCTLGGLALALAVAALLKRREGFRVKGRLLVFLLFLLLESPTLVYAGVLGGTVAGIFLVRHEGLDYLLLPTVGGGAAVGIAFGLLREVRQRYVRLGLVLALAAGLVAGALAWFGLIGEWSQSHALADPKAFGLQLLLGIPFFYVLTFAGNEEESEVEIAAMCAALGLGAGMLLYDHIQFRSLAFLLPMGLYLVYTVRVLPGLRVLKHAFRGLSYARVGRHRRALQAFRRALQLDPQNKLAREGFWDVHRSLDLDQLAGDSQTLSLVDLDLCLDRAGSLLLSPSPPPAHLDEANRLLDMVLKLQPERRPQVDYWRAVALTHARRYDEAAAELGRVLDPAPYGADNPFRRRVLLPAWQLALLLHEELRRRVGAPQLAQPGRRMEAIAAVERHLAENPDDQAVWGLKRVLYHDVTEAEYDAFAGTGLAASHFDHPYVQQLGLALIDDNARWQRGGEYLRLAARGQPSLGPSLFVQVAKAHQRAGNGEGARHNFELAKRAGRSVGPKNLADGERQTYFATLKYLGEYALYKGDVDAAVENFQLYTEYERSGIETLRTLADLYARKGDALSALRATDQALVYNPRDKDLLARKDTYYYSVTPEQLRARLESVRAGFDVEYCLTKAQTVLDGRHADAEWLDVARHLAQLALIVRPGSLSAQVLQARIHLRYGERNEALALLESVHSPKPEKFASDEDEESWYLACQLLGDLYMELERADLAVPCYVEFRKSAKSGARTLYKLGQAYEQLGDRARAVKAYKQVTAYEGNPLVSEAHDALYRLQAQS
jgi:tetratricopeptide (TPR) repeat protein